MIIIAFLGCRLVGKRVLVVEARLLVILMVEDLLTDAGCIVVGPYRRVSTARAAAEIETIDVALLDMNVANEKVVPVAEALELRRIPSLFLTGYGSLALSKDRSDAKKPLPSDD